MTRESFRWRILGEGARQFQPECFCCFEVLAAFCKGRKICAKFGTACRNSHWNIRETGSVSSSDRRHPVPAQLFRHLPSSGSSANAEHSWLEHPTPHGTSFPVRSRSAEELPQIFFSLKQRVFYKYRTLLAAALRASPHTIPPLKRWAWQGFLSLRKTAGRRRKADPL